jgi:hypothetical protein
MDDELRTPITTQPEDLFVDLREQTAVARLAEGLLCYTDPGLASVAPDDDVGADEIVPPAD